MRINGKNSWPTVALGAVVLVAVVNLVQMTRSVPPPPFSLPGKEIDPVMRHERRMAALREALRARALNGTIGYIGELPANKLAENSQRTADFYLTQFALVPLTLDTHADPHEWAVTNFRSQLPESVPPPGWRVVEDFGEGVRLLRKAAP